MDIYVVAAVEDVPMANDCHDPGTGDVTQQTNC